MKKYLAALFLLAQIASAENVPGDVKHAISEALKGKWEFKYFEKNKTRWGFDASTKLSDIKAGDPFQVYCITQEKFEASNDNAPVSSLITSRDDWRVPLYVNGELMESVMFIGTQFGDKKKGEKWSAGIFQEKVVVQAWEQIQKAWPERSGYHPKLVMLSHPNVPRMCFFVPEKGDSNLTAFAVYQRVFALLPSAAAGFGTLASSRETLGSLRAKYMEQHRKSDSTWKEQEKKNDILVKEREQKTEYLWKDLELQYGKSSAEKAGPSPVTPVMAWWEDMAVEADSAIIPAGFDKKKSYDLKNDRTDMQKRILARLEMDDNGITIDNHIKKTALPLRAGARPIDQAVKSGQNNWYMLYAGDGVGFIRIGATGPLVIDDAPYEEGKAWGPGGSHAEYDGPPADADLREISKISITQMAVIWKVKTAFLKITATGETPVSYRISFVSELPENRTGCHYEPGVAANQYVMGVAYGNLVDLYRTTRIHFTMDQAMQLREKLFGIQQHLGSFLGHRRPDALEPTAEGKLHVQHIILSDEKSTSEGRHWAFRIICIKRDGLWLVADAKRDPELSDSQVAEIVERDMRSQTR